MAQGHMNNIVNNIPQIKLVAGADLMEANREAVKEKFDIPCHDNSDKLLDSGEIDAVLIATPHWFHPPLSMAAFERGLHVLTEKPVAVTAKAALEVMDAHAKHPDLLYAGMFQQRCNPQYKMVKELVETGQVGELVRTSWIITNWYRTQAYYNSGGWRATWKGEGGGVLLNQCPHQLDLFTWIVGVPNEVSATIGIGKYHDIEVEDEATAILKYPNGATGVWVTSSGEAPGANRFEVVGTKGTVIVDGNEPVKFIKLAEPTDQHIKTCDQGFRQPPRTTITMASNEKDPGHAGIMSNFANVILGKEDKLIAPAAEGIHGLELSNAIIQSGIENRPVKMPGERDAYAKLMDELIAKSKKRD